MTGFWFRICIIFLGIGLLAGFFQLVAGGNAGIGVIALGMGLWVAFQVWHLQKMVRWLNDFRLGNAPTGLGAWDLLYAAVYRLARSYERQQSQLQEMLKSFRSVTDAMPDGVVSLDDHHQITYASLRAEQHLGLQAQADLGRNILNLLRHPDFVKYLESGVWKDPVVLRGVPRPDRILQLQVIPYGQSERLLLTRDITQIERLETTRRDFVANVSHELKTPLTVLSGYIETLRDLPLDPSQRGQALTTMGDQAERMQRLIDDLLTLGRLETEQNPPGDHPISMTTMLARLVREAEALGQHGHTLSAEEVSGPPVVLGEERELYSAFSNLVNNAVRYTPKGGGITLSWRGAADGSATFSVRDSGPGIESQHLSRLTERFYRIDKGRSRETGGTGLGLAIVKHVASRHGAELKIESTVGQGSCFSLRFPRHRLRQQEARPQEAAPILD
ncbi:MAG: phosphate regulon sensor histidine kinase PhoR [Pseudomonadota bacterium]|jgi:two-component system phosphate regulon sensor histidine kinase PhoR